MTNDNSDEHPNLKKEDWRLEAVGTIIKGKSPYTGKDYAEGDVIKKYIPVSFKKGSIGFGLPNPTALFLNSAYDHMLKAKFQFDSLPIEKKKKQNQVVTNENEIFDYFEYLMVSIILSYTAIESFTNEYIPEDYTFEQEVNNQKKILTKDEIIWLPLDIRILEILPIIFTTKLTRRQNVWREYKILKNLRDRIIHMRSKDLYPPTKEKNIPIKLMKSYVTIWNSLINYPVFNGPKIAVDLIGFFLNYRLSSNLVGLRISHIDSITLYCVYQLFSRKVLYS